MTRHLLSMSVVGLLLAPIGAHATWLNDPASMYEVRGAAELGFVGVPHHTIQFGVDGTRFDYVRQGSQNILFQFRRLSAELHLKPRHTIVFLYQPLDVRTEATLLEPLILDSDTFVAGTPMDFRYGFDFYRASWQYDFAPEPEKELAVGVSLQIRDATISFSSKNGEKSRVYQDLGPVPVLRFRGRLPLTSRAWLGTEIDGFYAQGKFVTGSTNVQTSFRGAILDASLRYGLQVNEWLETFINLRYLGGGASGQQVNPENPAADGYTDNWLNTITLSLGCNVK